MKISSSRNRIKQFAYVFCLLSGMLLSAHAHAQSVEAKVKAAFLYNFLKYVEWPSGTFESSSSTIVVGIVGSDSLSGALDSVIEGKTANGRRIIVRHLRWSDDLSQCQELFVPNGEMGNARRLDNLRNKPVLVVGESTGFAKRHGQVNFVEEGNRIRFEINGEAASQAGLTISSKLLSLGKAPT